MIPVRTALQIEIQLMQEVGHFNGYLVASGAKMVDQESVADMRFNGWPGCDMAANQLIQKDPKGAQDLLRYQRKIGHIEVCGSEFTPWSTRKSWRNKYVLTAAGFATAHQIPQAGSQPINF